MLMMHDVFPTMDLILWENILIMFIFGIEQGHVEFLLYSINLGLIFIFY